MTRLSLLINFIFLLLGFQITYAQNDSLHYKIARIAEAAKGKVGVAILHLETGDTMSYHGDGQFPMMSVVKFPLAMAVLNEVDKGNLTLDQKIHISKSEMSLKLWSPLRDLYPAGDVDISVAELLKYNISLSDNIACDILLKTIGGPKKVEEYIHGLGIKGIAVNATEKQMAAAWEVQYSNWCKAKEMVRLLGFIYQKKILSQSSSDFLLKIMTETTTGTKRIKGLLPKGTVVAHKTGTSGTRNGLTPGTNDVGIIALPNGKHIAIAVFVSDSRASEAVREGVIARISKTAWDYLVSK